MSGLCQGVYKRAGITSGHHSLVSDTSGSLIEKTTSIMRVSKVCITLAVLCLVAVSLFDDVDAKRNKKHKKHRKNRKNKNKGKKNEQESDKPNFIFFLVDDLGYNDVGFHDSSIKSPVIDQLASEGMIIENNYVAPVCTPSRGAILTGKYTFNIGQQHGVFHADTPDCLTKDVQIAPEVLKGLGYKTYMLGKWHQGFCNITCTPNYRGFDEFYGFYNGDLNHYSHLFDGFFDWRHNEDFEFSTIGQYATFLLRDRAVKNIEDHADSDSDKPMYMYFALPTVHTPMEAPIEYTSQYMDEPNIARRTLKAMVTITDDVVDAVVKALKENNMYDNTVIMFSSDNGGESGFSSNLPLRGGKASSWEGGVRVPAFIHSPLMKESAGTVSHGLFHESDWFPTMLSLAGGEHRDSFDGYDQTDFLFNGKESARDVVPIQIDQMSGPVMGASIIRSGKWKLIKGFPGIWNGYGLDMFMTHTADSLTTMYDNNTVSSVYGTYSYPWGAIAQYANSLADNIMLFDLEADPTETTDLAAENPDVVEEILALLKEYEDNAVEVPPKSLAHTGAANAAHFDGMWSSGWC